MRQAAKGRTLGRALRPSAGPKAWDMVQGAKVRDMDQGINSRTKGPGHGQGRGQGPDHPEGGDMGQWGPGMYQGARPRGQGHRPDHGDSAWGLDRSSSSPYLAPLADHDKAAVITI